ncbi:MAG TPA: hypothetical protein VFF67_04300 [Thermoplasmata archaeon]|nr:hypothetical protein [Thermoplasmata archaeon]
MRPVPESLVTVALPARGEVHTDFWGPMATEINGWPVSGFLVLTNYRFLFVRNAGGGPVSLGLQVSWPLTQISHVTAQANGTDVFVGVNHLVFHGSAPRDQGGWFADEIRRTLLQARQVRLELLHSESSRVVAAPTSVIREREVIREIVRIPCRYCHNLVDQTAVRCPSCGAGLK